MSRATSPRRRSRALCIALAVVVSASWAANASPRVISINLCADQILVPLADPDQILGLSPFARDVKRSGVAAAAERLPILSGTAEEVLALEPDLVLSGSFTRRATRELLLAYGIRVVELDDPQTLDEAKAQLRRVGELIGQPARAAAAVARIDAAATRARATARPGPIVMPLERRGWTSGGATLLGAMLRLVGAGPAFEPGGLGRFVTLEEIVARRPDLLLVTEAGDRVEDQGSALLLHPALARSYPPSRRVALPDTLDLFCGGPAIADTLDRLAAAIAERAGR